MKKMFSLLLIMMLFSELLLTEKCVKAVEPTDCVDVLVENKILRGDGVALRLDDAITWGEYATLLNRVYSQDLCLISEQSFDSWKEASLFVAKQYMSQKIYEVVCDKFQEPISASDIINVTGELFSIDGRNDYIEANDLLCWHGVNIEIFPYSNEIITRRYACVIVNNIFYKNFARKGDYCDTESILCYTPKGLFQIVAIDTTKRQDDSYPWDIIDVFIESSKDIDNSKFLGMNRNTEKFFKNNIEIGQNMNAVFALIGRAYLYNEHDNKVEFVYFIDDGTQKALLTFENNTLKKISFEDARNEKVVELRLYQQGNS